MEPSPLGGAMIDAWLERYSDLAAPPLAQCSYARRATANPCNNPSAVRVGLRAPRRSPGPQYMPRSASPVGLARRVLRPQNNSTPDCYFYDPVVLASHIGRGTEFRCKTPRLTPRYWPQLRTFILTIVAEPPCPRANHVASVD